MVLAPRFQVRDVCLVQSDIHKCPAGLIAEPAAHPRREITRLCRRHSQILVASNCAHIDDELCICSHWKKRDCKRCTNQSKPHFVPPFRCHQGLRALRTRPCVPLPQSAEDGCLAKLALGPIRLMSALGHKQTFAVQNAHVRFTPKAGHVRCYSACPLWANSGQTRRGRKRPLSAKSWTSTGRSLRTSTTLTLRLDPPKGRRGTEFCSRAWQEPFCYSVLQRPRHFRRTRARLGAAYVVDTADVQPSLAPEGRILVFLLQATTISSRPPRRLVWSMRFARWNESELIKHARRRGMGEWHRSEDQDQICADRDRKLGHRDIRRRSLRSHQPADGRKFATVPRRCGYRMRATHQSQRRLGMGSHRRAT